MLNSILSQPYSKLFIVGDGADWAIDEEAKALEKTAQLLNLKPKRIKKAWLNIPQIVHYSSQFSILDKNIYRSRHKISVDYFHGKPELGESYRKCFEAFSAHPEIARIRVSNSNMKETLIENGLLAEKIQCIPIGVDLSIFTATTQVERKKARENLGIPENAIVIGSFQKDGIGWAEGDEPKLIKGPDIFLKVIDKIKKEIPELFVLLSGPSRGFIKNGLTQLGVPFKHVFVKEYKEIGLLYDALDLYLITSREEGGPKACLESMAKGVPLVATGVGQVVDIVKSGENAIMTSIENAEELSNSSLNILTDSKLREKLIENGIKTAETNSLKNQIPQWKEYFEKLVTS